MILELFVELCYFLSQILKLYVLVTVIEVQ